ncbi:MAG TPA: hypothetical protein VLZ56_01485, partial [Mycoplana sp.]|nr:hypothetical protein [Mycoplana sp.]
MRRSPSALLAAGPAYFEHLHAMYRADPASVDESWRAVFVLVDDLLSGEPPNTGTALPVADALRQSGHLIAAVNPLGSVGERALSHPDAAGVPKPVDLTDPAYAG